MTPRKLLNVSLARWLKATGEHQLWVQDSISSVCDIVSGASELHRITDFDTKAFSKANTFFFNPICLVSFSHFSTLSLTLIYLADFFNVNFPVFSVCLFFKFDSDSFGGFFERSLFMVFVDHTILTGFFNVNFPV